MYIGWKIFRLDENYKPTAPKAQWMQAQETWRNQY